jgi:hypothetical protein
LKAGTIARTFFGLVVWSSMLFYLRMEATLDIIAGLLLFAPLVVLPLALPQIEPLASNRTNALKTAIFLQPMAATIAAASFLIPAGVLAGTFAIAWLPFSFFLVWHAVTRLRRRTLKATLTGIEEACADAAMLYLPIGAVWLLASRLGAGLLGFEEPVVLLTAVHFHFAGFAAPLIAAQVGRQLRRQSGAGIRERIWGLYFLVACLVILGPALVAAGISLSPGVEFAAAALLGSAYIGLAVITLWLAWSAIHSRVARACLIASSVFAILGMLAAGLYAFGNFSAAMTISIPQMLNIHGWLNALGFVFLGILGWGLSGNSKKPPSRS